MATAKSWQEVGKNFLEKQISLVNVYVMSRCPFRGDWILSDCVFPVSCRHLIQLDGAITIMNCAFKLLLDYNLYAIA
jgi:hypothetical protein